MKYRIIILKELIIQYKNKFKRIKICKKLIIKDLRKQILLVFKIYKKIYLSYKMIKWIHLKIYQLKVR